MPTYSKGFLTVGAFKKATTWGTAVAAGALNGFEFNSETLATDAQFIQDTQVSGQATRLFGDKGNEFHNGEVNMDLRYEGLQTLLACCLGTAGVPVQVGSDNAYRHVLKVNNSLEGIFGTLVFNKQVAVWEYTTAKLAGIKLTHTQGQRAKLALKFISKDLNFNTGGGTNNTTTIANVTLPANRDFALFTQLKVLVNTYSGSALAAGTDDVYVTSFELNYDNSMPTNDVTTQFGNKIDEPVQDGFTNVTGKITFSKYQTGSVQTLLSDMLAKTRKKMLVQWTGPVIGATAFQYTMYFPDVQFSKGAANVPGAARIPLSLEFEAHRALALPTGFPAGYTGPLTIENINQVATDALA